MLKAPRNWTKVQYFTYVKHVHFIHFSSLFYKNEEKCKKSEGDVSHYEIM